MQHVDPPDLKLWPTLRHLFPLWRAQWRLVLLGLVVRARLHGALARDPDPDPADDRQRDRRRRHVAAAALPRPDPRDRRGPLRRQLHPPLRDRADRDRRRGAAARDDVRRLPPLPARVLRPARDRRGDLARDERHLPRALLHRLGRRPGDPERDDARRRRDRARRRSTPGSRSSPRSRCRRSRSSRTSSRTRSSRSRGSCRRRRATSPRPPTRPSSASRWCRRSAARTTCASASAAAPRPSATRRCGRPASRRASCPGLIFLPSLAIAAVLCFGGRDAIAGKLTIGEFTLFITLLLQLVWPLEALGWIINLGQRATAAASRCFAWLDAIEPLPEPAAADAAAGRAADGPDRGRPLQLRRRQRGALGRRPRGRAGRDRRRVRRDRRRARRRCSTCCRASTTRPRAAC